MRRDSSRDPLRRFRRFLALIAIAAAWISAPGCTRERLVKEIYACSEWRTEIEEGGWNGLRIGDERRVVLRRLRELEFGEVRGLTTVYRAPAAEPEASALAGLAISDRWETGRERWWGRQSLTLDFEGEALARIEIARVLFLH